MNTTVKIVRSFWGDDLKAFREVPPVPIYPNQVVYVWSEEHNTFFKNRGYETRIVNDDKFKTYNSRYAKKLVALDLSLKEFGEVMMIDWDCLILREIDDTFYKYLLEKPIQCAIYSHHKDIKNALCETFGNTPLSKEQLDYFTIVEQNFNKYSWRLNENIAAPNFGFFYSRNPKIGEELLNIVNKYSLEGCIEEHAMWIYVNCSMDEYIDLYHPRFMYGVSNDVNTCEFRICEAQREMNRYVDTKILIDEYLKHI